MFNIPNLTNAETDTIIFALNWYASNYEEIENFYADADADIKDTGMLSDTAARNLADALKHRVETEVANG